MGRYEYYPNRRYGRRVPALVWFVLGAAFAVALLGAAAVPAMHHAGTATAAAGVHAAQASRSPAVASRSPAVAASASRKAASGTPRPAPARTATSQRARQVAAAISFARKQLGKPYLWGGTGPAAWDCSGLTQAAMHAAGVSIERTSQDQWATETHIAWSKVRPGDLIFFPGSDGSSSAPGHVALVIAVTGYAQGQIIQAYATGYPVEVSGYSVALASANDGGLVGFTDPIGGS